MRPVLALTALLVACGGASSAASPAPSVLDDLPPDVAADVLHAEQTRAPAALLEAALRAARAFRFDTGLVSVDTDRRWFRSLPSTDPGSPLLELRRWPGDTVLAAYALTGQSAEPPAIEHVRWEQAADGRGSRGGTLDDGTGPRRVLWLDRPVEGVAGRVGLLLIPGDAGLGPGSVAAREAELLAVASRLVLRPEAWPHQAPLPPGTPPAVPVLDPPARSYDEGKDPWQVFEGPGCTFGLPPGLRARRLDGGIPPPTPLAGAQVWIRGRFLDRAGESVGVGDAERFGYLAERVGPPPGWAAGELPPVGAPRAQRLASEPFPLLVERAGAREGRAERWVEPGRAGEWLVFRLAFEGRGLEIGLPVLEGRRSPALFWIPVTVRGAGVPVAPPPIDPAARFGIEWHWLTRAEQAREPWIEGRLRAPGLQVEVPRGWSPVASLRTSDGFPIRLVDTQGRTVGTIRRVEASAIVRGGGWAALSRPGRFVAREVHERPDGARLLVAASGAAFLLEPAAGVDRRSWSQLLEGTILRRP